MNSTRTLGAILLNPAAGGGARTEQRVQLAAELLGCKFVEIANLCTATTVGIAELSDVAADPATWQDARSRLERVIADADELLFGWGVSRLSGRANSHLDAQIRWVQELAARTHKPCWVAGPGPRHPSRWHQLVSDLHGRTSGGTFDERLRQVLRPA